MHIIENKRINVELIALDASIVSLLSYDVERLGYIFQENEELVPLKIKIISYYKDLYRGIIKKEEIILLTQINNNGTFIIKELMFTRFKSGFYNGRRIKSHINALDLYTKVMDTFAQYIDRGKYNIHILGLLEINIIKKGGNKLQIVKKDKSGCYYQDIIEIVDLEEMIDNEIKKCTDQELKQQCLELVRQRNSKYGQIKILHEKD